MNKNTPCPPGLLQTLSLRQAVFCLASALLFSSLPAEAVKFRLPLSSDTSVHYYYDTNSGSGVQSWNCQGQSYNGHRGSDFSGGPRGRAIFAGAVATLDYKIDGFGDGYLGSPDGGGFGNYVRLKHGTSGFMSYYAHMNKGSVTSKSVGSSIACGEQVGGVGTSGSSTGLHLHFEVRVNGTADDPYKANSSSCGGPLSYWVNQGSGSPSTACESTGCTQTISRGNQQAGFTASSNWSTGTSATDKNGTDYRFRSTAATSDAAKWTATLNCTGTHTVQAWWPQGSNRSKTAPYIVERTGGTTTFSVNQQVNGGAYRTLGTVSVAAGSRYIQLSCWTTTGFVVMADAVRWVKN